MDYKQKKLFRKVILKTLKEGPKSTIQIYDVLKRELPKFCDDIQDSYTTRLKWKHGTSNLLFEMKNEFLIYPDRGKSAVSKWHLVDPDK